MLKKTIGKVSLLVISVILITQGCKKDRMAKVKIQIDYLSAGGYYNDNIDGVPTGLTTGTNGPYTADPDKTYTLEYKADANFPVITRTWSPTSGHWTIRCYVQGNTAYMLAIPGD